MFGDELDATFGAGLVFKSGVGGILAIFGVELVPMTGAEREALSEDGLVANSDAEQVVKFGLC
jgi:hypothetical protein